MIARIELVGFGTSNKVLGPSLLQKIVANCLSEKDGCRKKRK